MEYKMSDVQSESAGKPSEGGKLAGGRLNAIVIVFLVMAICLLYTSDAADE